MEIPKIAIPNNKVGIQPIPRVYTPEWLKEAPTVIPPAPPVTSQIGVPIVNIPGCVEAHESNKESLKIDDPRGVKVYCDSGVPSFNPIDYNKDKLKWEQEKVEPPKIPPPNLLFLRHLKYRMNCRSVPYRSAETRSTCRYVD